MSEPTLDVSYVAKLARIDLSKDEIDRFQNQLGGVMEHIAKLSEVDVEGIEATSHATDISNQVRLDEPVPSLGAEALLANAPDQSKGQLKVPKVVDA
jgi:aspartyl-tRNA(Asn)/glutamyl-tRNA(Gln) amidotransferase subunit C